MLKQSLKPVGLRSVKIKDGFWGPKLEVNRSTTLKIEYQRLVETGRIDAWNLNWKEGMPNKPHIFWDSDCAKWVEAAAYALMEAPDDELEKKVDDFIDMIAEAQEDDGYVNTYFQTVEPDKRWTNLRDQHELYCAGHLIEAAVAYHQATGKRKMLDVLCRYADYIHSIFGEEEGKRGGYPGHEEIELALIRLYRETGEKRYCDLAKFFVDTRGVSPRFSASGDSTFLLGESDSDAPWLNSYHQDHLPVREQETAEGHSVRACYLYAGMADVASETQDVELLNACEKIWNNITQKRMYVTGGIGSARQGERFSFDYDLPNEEAYAETCASISLVFFAQRMLNITGDGKYADIMETALYNGVLSGVSLEGDKFFYENPLSVLPLATKYKKLNSNTGKLGRQPWFDCACCPPNLARLLASLGDYIYSYSQNELWVHLFVNGEVEWMIDDAKIKLDVKTDYPWDETVVMTIDVEKPTMFSLLTRLPSWCRAPRATLNSAELDINSNVGSHLRIEREWRPNDEIRLIFPMPVERIQAHPNVRQNAGKVALRRGPVVYCLEEVDNGPSLHDIALADDSDLHVEVEPTLFGGIPVVKGTAARHDSNLWRNDLYRPMDTHTREDEIKAIPYFLWANRKLGEMTVWLRTR